MNDKEWRSETETCEMATGEYSADKADTTWARVCKDYENRFRLSRRLSFGEACKRYKLAPPICPHCGKDI